MLIAGIVTYIVYLLFYARGLDPVTSPELSGARLIFVLGALAPFGWMFASMLPTLLSKLSSEVSPAASTVVYSHYQPVGNRFSTRFRCSRYTAHATTDRLNCRGRGLTTKLLGHGCSPSKVKCRVHCRHCARLPGACQQQSSSAAEQCAVW